MKKFSVTIAGIAREVNANEYSVAPKTNGFEGEFEGAKVPAWTTSGKGKSAVNNHYVYFRVEDVLYYFKSNAAEVADARKGLLIAKLAAPGAETPAEPAKVETPAPEAPKARRMRVKA